VFATSVPNDPAQNPQPDVDVTVGNDPVVGDAPPSDGTGVDVTVSPQTRYRRVMETLRHQPVLESSPLRSVHSSRFLRLGPIPGGPGSGFHTAAARAAAFPGLQPEVETSAASGLGFSALGGP
jgi:hypothetical protein